MVQRVALRRWLLGGLIAVLVLAAARILAIQGWLRPARIVSGSMAEGLLGERYQITCGECGLTFACGIESPPPLAAAVCPNCGSDGNPLQTAGRRRGQRVLIDRGAYWFASPVRFDVVALDYPGQPGRLAVKRVVGLPGERMSIRQGELFADGKLVRKSLVQFRPLATAVYHDRFRPRATAALPDRWRPQQDDSGWRKQESGYQFTPVELPGDQSLGDLRESALDWLVYHHWRCYASPHPRTAEVPVADNSGYNQGESRALQEMVDLVLSCRITSQGDGELALRVYDGHQWLVLWIEAARRRALVRHGEQLVHCTQFAAQNDPRNCLVEFGVLDQQVVLAFDGQECLRRALPSPAAIGQLVSQPIAVGVRGLSASVTDMIILRDVYYLDPTNLGRQWEMSRALESHEYMACGDNPSLSEDSRQWNDGRLAGDVILGKILPWPW